MVRLKKKDDGPKRVRNKIHRNIYFFYNFIYMRIILRLIKYIYRVTGTFLN